MAELPLTALLSYALVAFTIEFDNEFERQTPHRTSVDGSRQGPWLTSMVMWSNFLRAVPVEGISTAQLQNLTRIPKLSLAGMERWGYVIVEPVGGERSAAKLRSKPPGRDWVVRPTTKGLAAQAVWPVLFDVIEQRWRERFGNREIDRLRETLSALLDRLNPDLPEYLPVLGYGLQSEILPPREQPPRTEEPKTLPALVAKVLLLFTLEFERESKLSLSIVANVLRLLNDEGVRVRDLPRLSGVSKEAINMALGFLEKRRHIGMEPEPGAPRTKRVRLTPKGRGARHNGLYLIGFIEEQWQERFGREAIANLRAALKPLVGDGAAEGSPLFRGLTPYPDGWRASVPTPVTLPQFPMVLHRGGYPDGS